MAAALSPIHVLLPVFSVALLFAIGASVYFFYVAAVRRSFGRKEGIIMLASYAVYIIVIFALQLKEISPVVGG